jgi:DNA-binding MarR family transcriptional regulator
VVKFPLSPLPDRLHDALERLASLNRLEQLQVSGPQGLNPTQLAILRLVERRGQAGLRVKTIARELGLSQPTVTESLLALERKSLIQRRSDPRDKRALLIHASDEGRAALASVTGQMSQMEAALASLTRKEQAALLHIIIKMIRALLHEKAMPVQRMCVSCRHFRPQAQPDTDRPHFCDLVKAPFASADMQVDCGDHDAASPEQEAAAWRMFIGEMPGRDRRQETID